MSENNINVPKIRFPGFTDAWEQRRVSDFAEETYGGGTPKTYVDEYWGGNLSWIQSSDLNERQVSNVSAKKKITETGLINSASKLVPANSIAVVTRVGVGKLAFMPFEYATSQDFLSLSKLKVDEWFGVYSLYTKLQGELHAVQGTSIKGITKKELLRKNIMVPVDIDEQFKIGSFFKNIDTLITLHHRKLNHLQDKKKSLLQKMFPKDGADVPEIRFPRFTDAWGQRKLGELADFSKGNGYSKGDLVENGTPIILYGRLYVNYETVINEVDTFVEIKDMSVISEGNEVIVPASGETSEDISRASVVGKSGIILGGDLNIIKPKSEINPIFLALTISNGKQQKEMSKRAQGKSVVHLHNSDLKQVSFLYPKLEEQHKIGQFFLQIDHLITIHQRKLNHLQEQKKSLLQQMFV